MVGRHGPAASVNCILQACSSHLTWTIMILVLRTCSFFFICMFYLSTRSYGITGLHLSVNRNLSPEHKNWPHPRWTPILHHAFHLRVAIGFPVYTTTRYAHATITFGLASSLQLDYSIWLLHLAIYCDWPVRPPVNWVPMLWNDCSIRQPAWWGRN